MQPEKVRVDETGRATFLQPGLVTITCRAGSAEATTRILVRPGRRPRQTDAEWAADQANHPDTSPTSVGNLLPSLLDGLMPTAYAQSGGYSGNDFAYDEIWTEPRNLVGTPANRAIEPTAIGPVMPESSNFNFTVHINNTGGRGLGASVALNYNGQIWGRHGNAVTFSPVGGWISPGFSLGFGRILTYGPTSATRFVWIEPNGTPHYLGTGQGDSSINATYKTTDGSQITFYGNPITGGTLYFNDGTQVTMTVTNNRLLPTEIRDSNGNFVRIGYRPYPYYGSPFEINHINDTQGRTTYFQYDASNRLIAIYAPGLGGTSQNPVTRTLVQFDYQDRTLSYNFSELTVENAPTGAVSTLRHIYFPATGTGYLLSYSDYGMIYNISARRQMTIDAGGVISDGVESANVNFNYPTSGSTVLTDAPAFTQRTESPGGSYSYSTATDSVAQTKTFSVARPDGSTLNLTRSTNAASVANGLLVQSEVKSGSASFAKSVMTYVTDPGGSTAVQSITAYDDTGTPTKVDFDHDGYGNVVNKREYGHQISGQWQVRRRTNFTYKTDQAYIDWYLRSLVTETEIYDARENTSDADDVPIAKTAYIYDNYAATGGMEGYPGAPPAPGHNGSDGSFTVRGNVTGITQWIDVVANTTLPTRLKKYDKFGNVLREQVDCCQQKVFTYTQTDWWTNPPDVTNGNPVGVHLTGTTTYDFNTGLPAQVQLQNLTGGYNYDSALRVSRIDQLNGTTETATYNDSAMTATFTRTGFGTTTLTYDGWGRVVQEVTPNNGQVNTTYDSMGRVQSRTNPFTAGGQPGPATTYQYDALGRVTVVTLPGGNTVQNIYSGSSVTAIDQVGRKIKREVDGLGRLVKVTEQDSTGALTQETTYT